MSQTDFASGNKETRMIKKFREIMVVLCLYVILSVVQAFWALFCNYLIHDQREVFQKITPLEILIGWGSCIVHQMILGMFLFCSVLPMMNFPWSQEKYREQDQKCINFSRACIAFCAMIPVCFSYVCVYIIEIKMMNVENPPSMWTSAGALYALSGYTKALPFCILYGYAEMMENKQQQDIKVYVEETTSKTNTPKTNTLSNPKIETNTTSVGYVHVISPKILDATTETPTETVTENIV